MTTGPIYASLTIGELINVAQGDLTRNAAAERVKDSGEFIFFFHRGHKSLCFSIVRFHWLQAKLN